MSLSTRFAYYEPKLCAKCSLHEAVVSVKVTPSKCECKICH